jgi:acyl-CoA thioester hydrolase
MTLSKTMSKERTFNLEIAVQPDDIDNLGHVNNVVYVRWAQDVATQHWVTAAPPDLQQKYSWVVLRHEIDYKSPAFHGDMIQGRTWVEEFSGVKSIRVVQFIRDGKVLCEVKTTWCLLDAVQMKPTRVTESLAAYF